MPLTVSRREIVLFHLTGALHLDLTSEVWLPFLLILSSTYDNKRDHHFIPSHNFVLDKIC